MNNFVLTWLDMILTPILFILILLVASFIKSKYIRNPLLKKFFLPAIMLRFVGSTMMVIIYQFYYHGGDTVNYFKDSLVVTKAITDSPINLFRFIWISPNEFDPNLFKYTTKISFFGDEGSMIVAKFAGIINLFTFSSFVPTSILFGIIGLTGMWALMLTLIKIEPQLYKKFALATLFIPSVFFWGAGLLKDTLVLSAMGWLIFAFYNLCIERKKIASSILIIAISLYAMVGLKIYVAICIIPSLLIWFILHQNYKIKSVVLRNVAKPLLIITSLIGGIFAIYQITQGDSKYNLENILETSQITAQYISQVSLSSGGSYYSIGEIEYTPLGMLKVLPSGVIVSLFRPYIWEIRNPLMLLSAIESSFLFLLTFLVFFKVGLLRSLSIINKNPFLFSAFVFIIPFAFSIGISTMNFGTLARYKLPLIPLYLAAFYYLYFLGRQEKSA